MKEVNQSIAEKFDVEIMEQETDKDHINIIFRTKPHVQVSKIVNPLKSVSARLLFKKFPDIKSELCGGHLWSPSYFLASVGE